MRGMFDTVDLDPSEYEVIELGPPERIPQSSFVLMMDRMDWVKDG